jgi:hypothetical protein
MVTIHPVVIRCRRKAHCTIVSAPELFTRRAWRVRSMSLQSRRDPLCLRCRASGICHICAFLAFSSMASRNNPPRHIFLQGFPIRVSSQPSFIRAIRHSLDLPVLLLKLALHLEVDLTFTLDALLLHITDHTLVHSLHRLSVTLFTISSRIRLRG